MIPGICCKDVSNVRIYIFKLDPRRGCVENSFKLLSQISFWRCYRYSGTWWNLQQRNPIQLLRMWGNCSASIFACPWYKKVVLKWHGIEENWRLIMLGVKGLDLTLHHDENIPDVIALCLSIRTSITKWEYLPILTHTHQ